MKPSFEIDNVHPLLKTSKFGLFKDDYEKVGANGIFSVEPEVVKFSGYQLEKVHTL